MAKGREKTTPSIRRKKARPSINDSGFYSSAVGEAEQLKLPEAMDVEGLDQEIALLRVRLVQLLQEQPDNTTLLFKGIELLVKAVAARYRLSKKSKDDLSEAIEGVLNGIGGALGLEGFSEN